MRLGKKIEGGGSRQSKNVIVDLAHLLWYRICPEVKIYIDSNCLMYGHGLVDMELCDCFLSIVT